MLKYQSQLDHFSERGRERDCYLTPDHVHKAADTAGLSERSMSVFSAGQVYVRTVLVHVHVQVRRRPFYLCYKIISVVYMYIQ